MSVIIMVDTNPPQVYVLIFLLAVEILKPFYNFYENIDT